MTKYLRISSYIRKPFLIYDFATDPLNFLIFEKNFIFFFISVASGEEGYVLNLFVSKIWTGLHLKYWISPSFYTLFLFLFYFISIAEVYQLWALSSLHWKNYNFFDLQTPFKRNTSENLNTTKRIVIKTSSCNDVFINLILSIVFINALLSIKS